MTDYPATPAGKPLWLITLADLALLLVGFLVLLQATQAMDRRKLVQGLRDGFDAQEAAPMPVAAAGMTDFAVGSAVLSRDTTDLIAWARDAVRDPRVTLTVTGSTDGSATDVDAATGSAAILASDRARAVAALLAPIAPRRVAIATSITGHRRAAIVTLAFVGEQKEQP